MQVYLQCQLDVQMHSCIHADDYRTCKQYVAVFVVVRVLLFTCSCFNNESYGDNDLYSCHYLTYLHY